MAERIYKETKSGKIIPAGELVRCRDCRFRDNAGETTKWLPCMEVKTDGNWFCADGEPKAEQEGEQ